MLSYFPCTVNPACNLSMCVFAHYTVLLVVVYNNSCKYWVIWLKLLCNSLVLHKLAMWNKLETLFYCVLISANSSTGVYVLQNHEDDYNYWQSRQPAGDLVLPELNHGDRSLGRSILDTSDQDQESFNDIYTYPVRLDDYELDLDQQKSYQLQWML